MKYLTLFDFEIRHDYYIDQRCPDFQIEPTDKTQWLLCGCRCVLKSFLNGIRVLIPVNEKDNTPFIPLPENPIFVFRLRVQNPDFGLFTNMEGIGQATTPVFYTSTVPTSNEVLPLRMFTDPATPRPEKDIFADVEIKCSLPSVNRNGNQGSFQLIFHAKEVKWKYYIVTNQLSDFSIRMEESIENQQVTFSTSPTSNPADKIAANLKKQYPDKQCLRFVSSSPIPCQQAAREKIQLRSDGNVVINALPNPALHNFCIDSEQGYTLFEIIRYFAQ